MKADCTRRPWTFGPEVITYFAVIGSTDDPNGFKETKQEAFGFDTAVAGAPGPTAGAGLPGGLLAARFVLFGVNRLRRRTFVA
jgi:hypothetical protein